MATTDKDAPRGFPELVSCGVPHTDLGSTMRWWMKRRRDGYVHWRLRVGDLVAHGSHKHPRTALDDLRAALDDFKPYVVQ